MDSSPYVTTWQLIGMRMMSLVCCYIFRLCSGIAAVVSNCLFYWCVREHCCLPSACGRSDHGNQFSCRTQVLHVNPFSLEEALQRPWVAGTQYTTSFRLCCWTRYPKQGFSHTCSAWCWQSFSWWLCFPGDFVLVFPYIEDVRPKGAQEIQVRWFIFVTRSCLVADVSVCGLGLCLCASWGLDVSVTQRKIEWTCLQNRISRNMWRVQAYSHDGSARPRQVTQKSLQIQNKRMNVCSIMDYWSSLHVK